jgi:endonuclease/exonuclease/phosphatase family metal-dependent hydrolase
MVMSFHAATYNIHRCIGRDGKKDPERIARVIRKLSSSVIGLQEVESLYDGRPVSHQLNYLSAVTGLQAVAGSTILRKDGYYGNALLTTERIVGVRRHDLTVAGREPRGALDVDLDIEGQLFRVIVTHFGLRALERHRQAKQLLSVLPASGHADDTPTLVLADCNEWFPWGRARRWLDSRLGKAPAPATFPAGGPVFALDRIWVFPPSLFGGFQVVKTALTKTASDHLPLRVSVEA